MAAVIVRRSDFSWVLILSNRDVIDTSYSVHYLRQVAWSEGVMDENIFILGEYD